MIDYSEISVPSGSLIAYMSGLVKRYGGVNLAQGIPGFEPPKELLTELEDLINKPVHQYPAGNGDPYLVSSIIDLYSESKELKSSEVLVLQGATEAISLVYMYLTRKLSAGWNSLAFDPIYESYGSLPDIFGNELVRADFLPGGEIDWDMLKDLVIKRNVKLIFVNSPGNPYGKVWSQEEYLKLHQLSHELDFYILYDAVYEEIYFNGQKPFNPMIIGGDRLFYVNSFSKMLSITGWRVGFLICSEQLQTEIRKIHDYTGLCAVSILQRAIANYLMANNSAKDYSQTLRTGLSESLKSLAAPLAKLGFDFTIPQAGYFLWAKLPMAYEDGLEFSLRLFHQEQISMVPGIHFSEKGRNFVRINFARKIKELEAAIIGIETFLKP